MLEILQVLKYLPKQRVHERGLSPSLHLAQDSEEELVGEPICPVVTIDLLRPEKLPPLIHHPWGINSVVTYPCSVAVHTMQPSSTVSPKPVARSREHSGVTPSGFEVSWSLIRDTPEGLRLHSTATLLLSDNCDRKWEARPHHHLPS